MHVKKKDEYTYLLKKSISYVLGWQACVENEDALSTRRELKLGAWSERLTIDILEFDQGYGDCYANGESEPDSFDYESGI
jgi:hypothetical protein